MSGTRAGTRARGSPRSTAPKMTTPTNTIFRDDEDEVSVRGSRAGAGGDHAPTAS